MGLYHDVSFDETGMGWGYDDGDWFVDRWTKKIDGCQVRLTAQDGPSKRIFAEYIGFREEAGPHIADHQANFNAAALELQRHIMNKRRLEYQVPEWDPDGFLTKDKALAEARRCAVLDHDRIPERMVEYPEIEEDKFIQRSFNPEALRLTLDEVRLILDEERTKRLAAFAEAKPAGYLQNGSEVRLVLTWSSLAGRVKGKPKYVRQVRGKPWCLPLSFGDKCYASPPDLIECGRTYRLARTWEIIQCINKHVFMIHDSSTDAYRGEQVRGRNWKRIEPVYVVKFD